MDQSPAPHHSERAVRESVAAGTDGWESDLTDLAGLPLTVLDGVTPFRLPARLLDEVLRARSSIRGGGEGSGGSGARAD